MAVLDAFASSPWYIDHLGPIWLALPPEVRGRLFIGARASGAAKGLPNVTQNILAGGLTPILTMSYGDYRYASGIGRTRIALGQHGAGQSYSTDHSAYPGGAGQGQVSLFLVPNGTAAERTSRAYPRARVAIVGCPRLDTLLRKPVRDDPPVVAVSFHWDGATISPEMRSAWHWYRHAVPVLARTHRVIGHAHPRAMAAMGRYYSAAGIELVRSFDDVLRRADLYVNDNSSSLFEFASTGRPVVVLNIPLYRRDQNHGLRFWQAAGIGLNCDDPAQLPGVVDAALEDLPNLRAARQAALGIVYQPLHGGAELAAHALLDWMA